MARGLPIATAEHPDARTDLEGWTEYAKEKLDGRPLIISISGGKDSMAQGLLFREAGIEFSLVHMDTKWEHELTEKYVREYVPEVLGRPVQILIGRDGGMENLVRRKGMFPHRTGRFCTELLKVEPLAIFLKGLDDEPVNAVGVRAAESRYRSKLSEWERNKRFDCDVWRPLIRWSIEDVIEIHRRLGVKLNPLYTEMGATRVGCYPCIFSRKAEIRAVADLDPGRIDRIERLEAEVTELARQRYAKRGETFESLGYAEPGFFRAPRLNGAKTSPCAPIRDVVEWSRTKRGGKQRDLFQPDYAQEGCMRWGLCEPPD